MAAGHPLLEHRTLAAGLCLVLGTAHPCRCPAVAVEREMLVDDAYLALGSIAQLLGLAVGEVRLVRALPLRRFGHAESEEFGSVPVGRFIPDGNAAQEQPVHDAALFQGAYVDRRVQRGNGGFVALLSFFSLRLDALPAAFFVALLAVLQIASNAGRTGVLEGRERSQSASAC